MVAGGTITTVASPIVEPQAAGWTDMVAAPVVATEMLGPLSQLAAVGVRTIISDEQAGFADDYDLLYDLL